MEVMDGRKKSQCLQQKNLPPLIIQKSTKLASDIWTQFTKFPFQGQQNLNDYRVTNQNSPHRTALLDASERNWNTVWNVHFLRKQKPPLLTEKLSPRLVNHRGAGSITFWIKHWKSCCTFHTLPGTNTALGEELRVSSLQEESLRESLHPLILSQALSSFTEHQGARLVYTAAPAFGRFDVQATPVPCVPHFSLPFSVPPPAPQVTRNFLFSLMFSARFPRSHSCRRSTVWR